jgi:hypothetical protein
MFTFSLKYFLLALVLFLTEVAIALYVNDSFVRPYLGDFLVVILIYCAIRAVWKGSPWKIALGVLLFAYGIEVLQYFNFVDRLGLSHNKLARTVIGYGFDPLDLLAYTLGIVALLLFTGLRASRKKERA